MEESRNNGWFLVENLLVLIIKQTHHNLNLFPQKHQDAQMPATGFIACAPHWNQKDREKTREKKKQKTVSSEPQLSEGKYLVEGRGQRSDQADSWGDNRKGNWNTVSDHTTRALPSEAGVDKLESGEGRGAHMVPISCGFFLIRCRDSFNWVKRCSVF